MDRDDHEGERYSHAGDIVRVEKEMASTGSEKKLAVDERQAEVDDEIETGRGRRQTYVNEEEIGAAMNARNEQNAASIENSEDEDQHEQTDLDDRESNEDGGHSTAMTKQRE